MASSTSPAPNFDKNYLVDLGGWSVWREGKAIAELRARHRTEWNSPVLSGEIRVGVKSYFPRLNLRSKNFPDARCNCQKGMRGLVCEHVIALCLVYQRRDEDLSTDVQVAEAQAAEPASPSMTAPEGRFEDAARKNKAKKSGLKSLLISQEHGKDLRLKIMLPPNLETSAPKDAVVFKIQAEVDGELMALTHGSRALESKNGLQGRVT
ncbi:MAG: hypothetical protein MK080_01835 [Opitutales bacterium]|nr:hypothetical protein [Opitutales bacterium]